MTPRHSLIATNLIDAPEILGAQRVSRFLKNRKGSVKILQLALRSGTRKSARDVTAARAIQSGVVKGA